MKKAPVLGAILRTFVFRIPIENLKFLSAIISTIYAHLLPSPVGNIIEKRRGAAYILTFFDKHIRSPTNRKPNSLLQ